MANAPVRDAMLLTGGWLAAGAAAGAALWALAGVESPVAAALGGLALTAPLAAGAAFASLRARLAALEARLAAMASAAERAPTGAAAEGGLDRNELARALAVAARDALDRERGAIARQIAELGETQRRLDAAVAVLEARGAGSAPPPEPEPRAEPEPPERPTTAPPPAPPRAAAAIPASPPRPPEHDAAQPDLPLAEAPPPETATDWSVYARALDFPRDAHDDAGFAALEAAMRDRAAASLLQAAEDALTLLAQHGLYMEDLEVRLAPAAIWRRVASGERGAQLAAAGGVETSEAVDQVRDLMKADPIFRDTAMHLMRRFDVLLRRAAAAPQGDASLTALADSRTGRAFMLVAQAVGAFD